MHSSVSLKDRLVISARAVAWFVLALFFLVSLPVLLGVSIWLLLATVLFASIIAAITFLIIRYFAHRAGKTVTALSYLKLTTALSMILISLVTFPVFYFAYKTEADPLVLPQVTLSNGNKQVVFQGMIHVGSESFYKSVVYDLENALANGYDLFYEGVQPGDTESDKWFAESLSGGKDLSENYQALADVCGVKFQLNYFQLLAKQQQIQPDRHITADVTTRQLLDEWQDLTQKTPQLEQELKARLNGFDSSKAIHWLQEQDENRKKIGGILCRALLTTTLGKPNEPGPLSPVILDFRNRSLADDIINHQGDRIYITYGAAHLPGLIKELKKANPSWEVGSVKWIRALETEQIYQGDETLFIP